MSMRSIIAKCCFVCAIGLSIAYAGSSAFANTLCTDLTQSNRLPDGEEYSAVSLSYIYNGGKRGVRITVKENEDVLVPRKHFGIRWFGFNTAIEKPGINLKVTVPRDWIRRFRPYKYGAFGWFEVNISRRSTTLWKSPDRVNPLIIDMYHRSKDLSYSDFMVANKIGQLFAARVAHFTHDGRYYLNAAFSTPEDPHTCITSTSTTTSKPPVTTTIFPTSTTTVKPSTTTSKPASTTTVQPTTSSTVPVTTTSVLPTTTTSVLPTTSTTQPTTTTSLVPTTTTSPPSTTTSSVSTTTTAQPTTTTSVIPTTTSSVSTTTTAPSSTTTTAEGQCSGEIYLGGAEGICSCIELPPVDDPPYNRPGRRGLALTCGDIVDFCVCFDCEGPVDTSWTIECTKPDLASIVETAECAARVTVSDALCNFQAEVDECTVTVNDPVNDWSDSIVLQIGEIIADLSEETLSPETDSIGVDISVTNNSNTIRAMVMTIAECDQGEDNLACNECVADPDRALPFTCSAEEQPDGSCRVVLYSTVDLINEGEGVVATVLYDVIDADACPHCVDLCITEAEAADQFNESLCTCTDSGQVCFDICGDIYPRDCLDPGCAPCGDEVVDLFDILEMVDIILGFVEPTACQMDNGDVPNGMPPYCGSPSGSTNCLTDGVIDIYDLLVINDMALDKANCCDYCLSGKIY